MLRGDDRIMESALILQRSRECLAQSREMTTQIRERLQTTIALVLETEDLIRRSDHAIVSLNGYPVEPDEPRD